MRNVSNVRIMQLGEKKFRVDYKNTCQDRNGIIHESNWIVDFHYSSLEEAQRKEEDLLKYGTEGIEVK